MYKRIPGLEITGSSRNNFKMTPRSNKKLKLSVETKNGGLYDCAGKSLSC